MIDTLCSDFVNKTKTTYLNDTFYQGEELYFF